MRAGIFVSAFLFFLLVPSIPLGVSGSGKTQVELTETATGRRIFSALLRDGERVVLTWRNSLFGLIVTEVFEVRHGSLLLTEVTFVDSRGDSPPAVAPRDIEDLYQTGGSFSAHGLSKPFTQVVYRIGEVGEPKIQLKDRIVDLKREVGFGGAIRLSVRPLTKDPRQN